MLGALTQLAQSTPGVRAGNIVQPFPAISSCIFSNLLVQTCLRIRLTPRSSMLAQAIRCKVSYNIQVFCVMAAVLGKACSAAPNVSAVQLLTSSMLPACSQKDHGRDCSNKAPKLAEIDRHFKAALSICFPTGGGTTASMRRPTTVAQTR